jgi:hypothetical protein
MPEVNPTTEATANDVVQSDKASGSFQGHMADASMGNSSFWKQKQLEIVELITSQEDASNQLSNGITAFVVRTSTMKKVCIPYSPRAPWKIFIDNPSWCSKRNYFCIFQHIAPERRYTLHCSGAPRELSLDAMSSPQALWRILIQHKALRRLMLENRHE